jgi:hypothetical protein
MSVCSRPNPPTSCDPPVDPPDPPDSGSESNPTGSLNTVSRQPAGLSVTGTAKDPDTTAALQVVITVDGTSIGTLTATAATGAFSGTLPTRAGTKVCAKAVNKGPGVDTVVGCLTYTVSFDPYGSLDVVSPSPAGLLVQGWSVDPDTASPISVQVYLDGAFATTVTASGDRPDVATAYPGYGSLHGYDVTVPAGPGLHTICAYAINTGPGTSNPLLACRQVTEPGPPAAPRVRILYVDPTVTPASIALGISGGERYTVQRAVNPIRRPTGPVPGTIWSTVLTNVKLNYSWSDTDVVPGNTYCYQAFATNAYGTSAVSSSAPCAKVPLP